ncbi:hypothetical protein BKA82DRAFT_918296 [Pisolithus tinctorius]|uniref:Uncharacterized protein n=1 Tax=Pisolithus tinctorius Marx 270 TaxID=870435 RepID=A0A0C3NND3_PISTI|nr:hypothetical protein BKA82DRAFT_918296 [Pisolithus tinctorius]KIN97145.1 hypothetical protein M404DRAFT_918296 [Pisolithus tinctorius Marx 270]
MIETVARCVKMKSGKASILDKGLGKEQHRALKNTTGAVEILRRVLHEDEWEKFASWHGERWRTLLADVEKECNGV